MKYSKKYRKNRDMYWNSFLYMRLSMWSYNLPCKSPCIRRNMNPYNPRYNQSNCDRRHRHCHFHCLD